MRQLSALRSLVIFLSTGLGVAYAGDAETAAAVSRGLGHAR